ncbi:A24 family peptidase [Planomonospora alba]|uniref:A24 family peptidase n=1 Tax=Planomonospora alba TaxID=161354 RepID=A0ABP6MTB1_9ACTN
MDTLVTALAGVLGLLVGSFLNVVVHRVPRAESLLRPGSHCPRCQAPVRPWQNVPVLSWLALRGRCAACAAPISLRYPLVELATALLFAAVAARIGTAPDLPAYLYLAAVAVALSLIDFEVKRLPDVIVLPSYLVAAALLAPAAAAGAGWAPALRALAAMAVLFAFYFALAWFHPGGMGFGDVKLAGLLGLYLGWLGWGAVVVGTFAAFLLGGLAGAVLLATGRAGRKTAVPFGPAMLAGALLALFAAGPITAWYGGLLAPSA